MTFSFSISGAIGALAALLGWSALAALMSALLSQRAALELAAWLIAHARRLAHFSRTREEIERERRSHLSQLREYFGLPNRTATAGVDLEHDGTEDIGSHAGQDGVSESHLSYRV